VVNHDSEVRSSRTVQHSIAYLPARPDSQIRIQHSDVSLALRRLLPEAGKGNLKKESMEKVRYKYAC